MRSRATTPKVSLLGFAFFCSRLQEPLTLVLHLEHDLNPCKKDTVSIVLVRKSSSSTLSDVSANIKARHNTQQQRTALPGSSG